MGVHDLWPILDPIAEKHPLTFLEGKIVAVDLSVWIVQSKQQKGLNQCKKPHLKNLFYRVKYLLTNKVSPVFIFDGKPPVLKANTIKDRNINQYSKFHNENYDGGSGQRESYIESLEECAELLQFLGVPYLKSDGEAESLCAYLNSKGVVDGCITEDSDVFLYGAETVFRGFNLKEKEIRVYSIDVIKKRLNIDREKLIALALLLGSDYKKGGVTGIGKETALNMLEEVQSESIIQRFYDYKTKSRQELFPNYHPELEQETISHCSRCKHSGIKLNHQKNGCLMCKRETGCLKKVKDTCVCEWHRNQREKNKIKYELKVYEKVHCLDGFPEKEIIDEYLNTSVETIDKDLTWQCPNLDSFQEKSVVWFGKSAQNIVKHILPIITSWQIRNITKGAPSDSSEFHYSPIKIIKEKTENGKKYFEVLWRKKGSEILDDDLRTEERIDDLRTEERIDDLRTEERIDDLRTEERIDDLRTEERIDDLRTEERIDDFSRTYSDVTNEYKEEIANKKKSPTKRIPSPAKAKGAQLDLLHNSQMKDFFPVVKKRHLETK